MSAVSAAETAVTKQAAPHTHHFKVIPQTVQSYSTDSCCSFILSLKAAELYKAPGTPQTVPPQTGTMGTAV